MNTARNMDRALRYESSRQHEADTYYLEKWGAVRIERHSYTSPRGHDFQVRDIDVTVTLPTGRDVDISEKFRSSGLEMCIELRTGNREGWTLTSEASGLCVFTPDSCYEVNMPELQALARDIYKNYRQVLDRVETDGVSRDLDYRGVQMRVRRVASDRNGRSWNGLLVCFPYRDLSRFGVSFRKRFL